MNRVLFIVGIILLFSCNNRTMPIAYNLPLSDSVRILEAIIVDSNFIFETGKLFVNNKNVIYCGKTDINTMNYHVFTADSGSYVSSFAYDGRGPGELLPPIYGGAFIADSLFLVYDVNQSKHVSYRYDGSYSENVSGVNYVKPILPWLFFVVDTNKYVSVTVNDRFILHTDKDTISMYSSIPNVFDNKNIDRGYFIYKSKLSYCSELKKFVSVTSSGAIMEIFSLIDEKFNVDTICYFVQPKIVEIRESQLRSKVPYVHYESGGFYDLSSNSNGIYVRYISGKIDNTNEETTILKFSWDGDLICKYLLEGEFSSFTISDDDSFAYAFERIEGVPYLSKINL